MGPAGLRTPAQDQQEASAALAVLTARRGTGRSAQHHIVGHPQNARTSLPCGEILTAKSTALRVEPRAYCVHVVHDFSIDWQASYATLTKKTLVGKTCGTEVQVEKKLFYVSGRTTEAAKLALQNEALQERRTESRLLHLILCAYFGLDPDADSSDCTDTPNIGRCTEHA